MSSKCETPSVYEDIVKTLYRDSVPLNQKIEMDEKSCESFVDIQRELSVAYWSNAMNE